MAEYIKKIKIDDSKVVGDLIPLVCDKFGISDFEEYSLVCEKSDFDSTINRGTFKRQNEKDMTKIRKKFHTEDDIDWLVHSKTLRQQDVTEDTVLILKRKYFFSDQNVSDRDPVQLQLLYIQIKDAVINGEHPITMDEAIKLAALQCQIERGSYYNNEKKNLSIDLKSHLPFEYAKKRGIEKKIKEAYKCFDLMKENIAKVEYIKLCRSFPTYGISFFLVKEKEKNKNRLVPILFGISKESVYRVDVKTKEIVERWPLTQISQWVPGANTFALSFGEYRNDYIIATCEGYRISQMLSGYIDIIMRKTKKQEPIQNDVEEESTIFEDCIEPQSGNIIVLGETKTYDMKNFSEINLSQKNRAIIPEQGHMIHQSEIVQHGALAPRRIEFQSQNQVNGEKMKIIDLNASNKPIKALVQIINSGLRTIEEIGEDLDESLTDYEDVCPGDEDLLPEHDRYRPMMIGGFNQASAGHLSEPAMRAWIKKELEKTIFQCNNHLSGISHGTVDLISKSRNCLARDYNSLGLKEEISMPSANDVNDISSSLLSIKINVPSLFNQVKRMNNCDKKFNSILDEPGKTADLIKTEGVALKVAAKDLAHALRNLMEAADVRKKNPDEEKTMTGAAGDAKDVNFDSELVDMFESEKIKNSPQYYIELIKAAMQVGNASRGLFHNIAMKKPDVMQIDKEGQLYSQDHDELLRSIRCIANEKNSIDALSVDLIREIDNIKQRLASQNLINDIKIYENRHYNQTIEEILHFNKTFEMEINCIITQIESCYFFIHGPEFQRSINDSIVNLQESLNCFGLMRQRFEDHANSLNRNRLSYLQEFDDGILSRLQEKISFLNEHLESFKAEVFKYSHQGNINQAVLALASIDIDPNNSGSSILKQAKFLTMTIDEISSLAVKNDDDKESMAIINELRTMNEKTNAKIQHIEENEIDLESEETRKELYELMKETLDMFNVQSNKLLCVCMSDQLELITRLTSLSATQFILTSQEIGQKQIYDGLQDSQMIFSNNEWTNLLSDLETKIIPNIVSESVMIRRNLNDYTQLHSLYKSAKVLSSAMERLISLSDDVAPLIKDKNSIQSFQYCLTSMKNSSDDLNRNLNQTKKIFSQKKNSKRSKKESSKKSLAVLLQNRIQDESSHLYSTLKANKKKINDLSLSLISNNLSEAIENFVKKYLDSQGLNNNQDHNPMTISQSGEEKKIPELAFILMREFGDFSQSSGKTRLRETSFLLVDEMYDTLEMIIEHLKELSQQYANVNVKNSTSENLMKILAYSEDSMANLDGELRGQLSQTASEINSKLLAIGSQCVSVTESILTRSIESPVTYENTFISETEKTLKEIDLLSMNIKCIYGYLPGNTAIQRLRAVSNELSDVVNHKYDKKPDSNPSDIRAEVNQSIMNLHQISKNLTNLASLRCSMDDGHSSTAFEDDRELIDIIKNASDLTGDINKLKSIHIAASLCENRLYQQFPKILNELIESLYDSLRYVDDKKRQEAGLRLHSNARILSQWTTKFEQSLNQVVPLPRLKTLISTDEPSLDEVTSTPQALPIPASRENSTSHNLSQKSNQIQAHIDQVMNNLRANFNLPPDAAITINKFPNINIPVSNQNFFECQKRVQELSSNVIDRVKEMPDLTTVKSQCETITCLARETQEILNASRQAAFLRSVSHMTSSPGRCAKVTQEQQNKIRMHKEHIDAFSKSIQSIKNISKDSIIDAKESIMIAVNEVCDIAISCLFDMKQMDRRLVNRNIENVREIHLSLNELFDSILVGEEQVTKESMNALANKVYDQKTAIFDLILVLDDLTSQIHSKISEKSYTEQDGILECNAKVFSNFNGLLEAYTKVFGNSFEDSQINQQYKDQSIKLAESLNNLEAELLNYPGSGSLDRFQVSLQARIKELDGYLMTVMMNPSLMSDGNLDDEIVTLGKLCQNICIYSRKIGSNVRQDRPEFLTHDLNDFNQAISRFIQVSKDSVGKVKKQEHRESLIQSCKTVIESTISYISEISLSLEQRQISQNLNSNYEQINLATCEFCNFLDQIGSSEGGKNSCVTIIKAACERLEDYIPRLELNPDVGFNSDEHIQSIHSKLINQSIIVQNVIESLNNMRKEDKSSPSKTADSNSKLAYEFSKLCDYVQTICYHQVLTLLKPDKADYQVSKARKLRHAAIDLGLECICMLQMPMSNSQKVLIAQENLSEIIKGFYPVLQVFMVNLNKLKLLIEAVDQVSKYVTDGTFIPIAEVITKAYSGSSEDANKSINYQSYTSNKSSVSSLKQSAMLASKEIIENLTALPNSEDELFIWAKMCHVKMANLTETIFHLVNKMYRANENPQDKYVQLNLLEKTKELALKISHLMEISKSGIKDHDEMRNQMVGMISANGRLLEEIQKLNSPQSKSNRKSLAIDGNDQQSLECINQMILFLSDKRKEIESIQASNRFSKTLGVYSQKNPETIQCIREIHERIDNLDKRMPSKDREMMTHLNDAIFLLRNLINVISSNLILFHNEYSHDCPSLVDDVMGSLEEILVNLYKMFMSIKEIFSQSIMPINFGGGNKMMTSNTTTVGPSPSSSNMPDISAPIKIASRSYRFASMNIIECLEKISSLSSDNPNIQE